MLNPGFQTLSDKVLHILIVDTEGMFSTVSHVVLLIESQFWSYLKVWANHKTSIEEAQERCA